MEASSSERPPERKVMPGTDEGTHLSSVRMVYSAIFWGVTFDFIIQIVHVSLQLKQL